MNHNKHLEFNNNVRPCASVHKDIVNAKRNRRVKKTQSKAILKNTQYQTTPSRLSDDETISDSYQMTVLNV